MTVTDTNTNDNVNVEALLARIAELESAVKPTTLELGEYNGHPVVKFAGEFRPFSLGFGKIRRILEMADQLKAMMAEQDNK